MRGPLDQNLFLIIYCIGFCFHSFVKGMCLVLFEVSRSVSKSRFGFIMNI